MTHASNLSLTAIAAVLILSPALAAEGFVTPASACWTLVDALAKGHEENQLRRISIPA
jgi:hypothetical protein